MLGHVQRYEEVYIVGGFCLAASCSGSKTVSNRRRLSIIDIVIVSLKASAELCLLFLGENVHRRGL